MAALEQAGIEAGLSRDAIRQALAEVRAETTVATEVAVRQPDAVVARTLSIEADILEDVVTRFMRRQKFRIVRHLGDRVIWAQDRSVGAQIVAPIDFNRQIVLKNVDEITTVVVGVPGDSRYAHVRFELDMAGVRRGWLSLPAVAGVVSVGGVVAAVALGTPEALLATPGVVAVTGGAYAGARAGYKGAVARAATEVERFFDELQHGR